VKRVEVRADREQRRHGGDGDGGPRMTGPEQGWEAHLDILSEAAAAAAGA
jgi:hypothetical protein